MSNLLKPALGPTLVYDILLIPTCAHNVYDEIHEYIKKGGANT